MKHQARGTQLALLLFACAGACSKPDPEEEERKAVARSRAEQAARHAKRMGTDPESVAARNEAAARASAEERSGEKRLKELRKEACQRLAQNTRDCYAGKPCGEADVGDVRDCTRYMKDEKLEKNPF